MYENKSIIDSKGYMVEKVVLFKDGETEGFVMQEGYQVIPYVSTKQTVNSREVEYLKPQWNGTEWIETATEQELNEAYPAIEATISYADRIASLESAITALMGV